MALIGTIAISMIAKAEKLQKGLKTAGAAINSFGAKAGARLADFFSPVTAAVRATGASLAYVFRPIEDAIGVTKQWGKALWAVAGGPTVDAIRSIGGWLGDWGKALKAVHGDKIAGIGRVFYEIGHGASIAVPFIWNVAKGLSNIVISSTIGGLKFLGRTFLALGGYVRQAVNQLGQFAAIAGTIAAYAVYRLAKSATALGEQSDRARIVFGNFAGDVVSQANLMGEAFGISKSEFIASASALGSIFKAAGYTQEGAAQLSVHFVKLATDLSSLAHIPVAEALEKIQSGLAGQVRPLREVGVFMSEEAVQAYAVAHGIAKLNVELTESQKIQARIGFITKGLADAQGNLALTAGSVANQTRSLQGRLENLAASIGTALLPIVGAALSELQNGVTALSLAWDDWTAGAVSNQVGVVGAVGATVESMGWLQRSVMFAADAFQVVKLAFLYVQATITTGIGQIIGAFAKLYGALSGTVSAITGVKLAGADFFDVWTKDLQVLSGSEWANFQKELAKPPASEAVNDYFTRAQERIKAMRGELAKTGTDISKISPVLAPQTAKVGDPKFASAIAAGTKEAANVELRARFGGAGRTAADQTAANTKKTNEILERIAKALPGARGVEGAGGGGLGLIGANW